MNNMEDGNRGTGRTHRMLLEVLGRCGQAKSIGVFFPTRKIARGYGQSFMQIAKNDPFCTTADVVYDDCSKPFTVCVNNTAVAFFSMNDDIRGVRYDVFYEDHSIMDVMGKYRQFDEYQKNKVAALRVFSSME